MKRLLKIPLVGLSLVLFLLTLLFYLYFFTTVPEQQLNDWLAYYFPQKIGYKFTVERAYRDIWKRIKLEGIKVYKVDGEELIPVGYMKSIEANYSLKDVLFQNYHFSDLRIIDVDLSFVPDSLHTQAVAKPAEEDSTSSFTVPNVSVDKIELDNINLQLLYQGEIVDLIVPVVKGSFSGEGKTIDVKIDSLNGVCPQRDFEIKYLTSRVYWANNDWMVESLRLLTARSNVEINGKFGSFKKPDYKFTFKLSPFDLDDVNSLTGLNLIGNFQTKGNIEGDFKKFKGNVTGDGNLYERQLDNFTANYHFESNTLYIDKYLGDIFFSPFDGSGYLNLGVRPERYGLTGHIFNLNLQNIAPDLYSSFTGNVDLTGEGLSEASMHMEVDMDLSWANIDIYHFDRARGKIDFDIKGISFAPGFTTIYKNTQTTFNGHLDYDGEIDLSGATHFGDLSEFQGQIFITDMDGVGDAEFKVTGPTLDFNIEGNFTSDSCRFYGLYPDSLNFNVDLKSFISHQVGRISGNWGGGDLYSVPIDSGAFEVLVSGERYFLENIYMENEHNKLFTRGAFDNSIIPPALELDTAIIVLWNDTVYTKTPLLIDVYDKEVEFQNFKLYSRSSNLDMTGVVTNDGQMALQVTTENLDINPLAAYFIKDRTFEGVLSGNCVIGGDFDNPEFDADIWIDGLVVDDIVLGKFIARGQYKNQILTLTPAELDNGISLYTITGTLPINLSFTSAEPLLPDLPISLKVKASGNTIALAQVFIASVENFESDFTVDINIGGTYSKPLANGSFTIDNGTLDLVELAEPLTDVEIHGRMSNDIIYIDTLSAYARLEKGSFTRKVREYITPKSVDEQSAGKLTGFGKIKILDFGLFDYDLNISGYGCEFYADAYDAQVLADLFLKVDGSSPPLVSGWAQVKRFELRDRFSKLTTPEGAEVVLAEDSTQWDINLELSAANNIWVKNAESLIETEGAADMEMKGDLTILREKGIYNILGTLDVLRGYFYLANLKFKLVSGEMVFDLPDTLDPTVDLNVTTQLMPTSQQQQYTDLDLVITGRLSNLQIGAASGSTIPTEDILFTLIDNMIASGQGENISENLTFIGGQLVRSLGNNSPVDIVDITREKYKEDPDAAETKTGTRLTVAKYISPKLFLTYSQRVSQENSGRTVGFEYIFNNNLSFEGRQGTGAEGVSFDINLQFEF